MTESKSYPSGRGASLKKNYSDRASLGSLAESWIESVAPYIRHPFEASRLGRRPALLVIDMQRFFLDESSKAYLPAAEAMLPRVNDLVLAFRKRALPVLYTRHVDKPGDFGGGMFRWWNHIMDPEDPMNRLHPDLEPAPEEVVIVKHHYSAFFETDLDSHLNELNATSVVVAGVMTHLCCESSARDAFIRGWNVIAVADCMATLNETLHLSSLRSLAHGFASPALSGQVVSGLGS